MTIDVRDPHALIEAACKTMDAIEALNKAVTDTPDHGIPNVTTAVGLMLQAVTAEATLALALYTQRDRRPKPYERHQDDRK